MTPDDVDTNESGLEAVEPGSRRRTVILDQCKSRGRKEEEEEEEEEGREMIQMRHATRCVSTVFLSFLFL